jgi:uncharacterized protein with HEPN domain
MKSDQPYLEHKVIAVRNRKIHGYWSVDLLLVWDVIHSERPALKAEVARLLQRREG